MQQILSIWLRVVCLDERCLSNREVTIARKFEAFDDYRRHLKKKFGHGESISYKLCFTVRYVIFIGRRTKRRFQPTPH